MNKRTWTTIKHSKEEERAMLFIVFTIIAGCVLSGIFTDDVVKIITEINNNLGERPHIEKIENTFNSIFTNFIFSIPSFIAVYRYVKRIDVFAEKRKLVRKTSGTYLLDKYYLRIIIPTVFFVGIIFDFYNFHKPLGLFLVFASIVGFLISGVVLEEEKEVVIEQ